MKNLTLLLICLALSGAAFADNDTVAIETIVFQKVSSFNRCARAVQVDNIYAVQRQMDAEGLSYRRHVFLYRDAIDECNEVGGGTMTKVNSTPWPFVYYVIDNSIVDNPSLWILEGYNYR